MTDQATPAPTAEDLALETLMSEIQAVLQKAGAAHGGAMILKATALTAAGVILASGVDVDGFLGEVRRAVERLSNAQQAKG